ncbi:plastocyanin/azurin family copper-binding protein [Pseudomonas aeruginosa]
MQQSGMLTPTGMASMDHSQMGHGMDHGRMMKARRPQQRTGRAGQERRADLDLRQGQHRLEFACNIPGHYQAGMVGQLTVQP